MQSDVARGKPVPAQLAHRRFGPTMALYVGATRRNRQTLRQHVGDACSTRAMTAPGYKANSDHGPDSVCIRVVSRPPHRRLAPQAGPGARLHVAARAPRPAFMIQASRGKA